MIKYKFAFNSLQETININEIIREKRNKNEKFTCISCGHEMVAVLGNKRAKHFRHKVITEIECSPETYLHKLAKLRFYQAYKNCLDYQKPFLIKILMTKICNFHETDFLRKCIYKDNTLNEFDITKYFKEIQIETKVESFIPDILLMANNGEKIFFEIYVTHASEAEKLNSKFKIIEFNIQTEDDITIIESCRLEESDKVKFYNFKKEKEDAYCRGNCKYGIVPYAKIDLEYDFFIVYQNGKSIILRKTVAEIDSIIGILYKEIILLHNIDHSRLFKKSLYKFKVVEVYQKGIKIKNCFLCRYHAINTSFYNEGTIFCKFLKNTGNSNMAINCQSFRPDPKAFSEYVNDYLNQYYDF